MQDIRKPKTHSRSKIDLDRRVAAFERKEYGDEIHPSDDSRQMRDVEALYRDRDRSGRDVRYFGARRSKQSYTYITIGIVIVVLLYLYTFVFNSAKVTVTPKYEDIQVSKVLTLGESGDLPYMIATTSKSQSAKLEKKSTAAVASKAKGELTIYNNGNEGAQRLIKNTRFETKSGLIFRLNESVVVPAKKGDTPGQVTTEVTADNIGEEYNIPGSDFTIPGFKNTSQYTLFYARSNKSFFGGSSGKKPVVSQSDLNAAKDEIALSLIDAIKKDAKDITKDGYLGLYDATDVVIEDNEADVLSGKTDEYSAVAAGYTVFVRDESLAKVLAQSISQYKNESVRLEEEERLKLTLANDTKPSTQTVLRMLAEGSPRIVWNVDKDALIQSLLGKDKEELSRIIGSFGEILDVTVSFRPFWRSSFPDRVNSVKIEERLPSIPEV